VLLRRSLELVVDASLDLGVGEPKNARLDVAPELGLPAHTSNLLGMAALIVQNRLRLPVLLVSI